MTTTTISRRLTTHLSSGGPRQRTLFDYQHQLTRSSQQYKNIISWLSIINHPSLKPSSYEIFSHLFITNALVWTESSNFLLSFPLNPAPRINIILYLFPQALLILLTAFTIPHFFPFMHSTKINNYPPLICITLTVHKYFFFLPDYHYTNCTAPFK